ncbi:mitogen-activated protein kinase kinase kinase SSK1 [Ascoidea rubescens DSM 1968]|uniref:CheY-like protein n=1 Tax=Ascoidea rubescens DSM 1968 TaxID=1344418 RepID=A0A1D2VLE3_9ASCO|nr:CheY-like protein [Ascoidea rubescens DSM 1968]ODV62438.1 CheY-like protein [Ascoidea rubescens DSM 1968]
MTNSSTITVGGRKRKPRVRARSNQIDSFNNNKTKIPTMDENLELYLSKTVSSSNNYIKNKNTNSLSINTDKSFHLKSSSTSSLLKNKNFEKPPPISESKEKQLSISSSSPVFNTGDHLYKSLSNTSAHTANLSSSFIKKDNSSYVETYQNISFYYDRNIKVIPRVRVLVVEDNIINSRILKKFLYTHDIPHKIVTNGFDAVLEFRKGGYHLIFMDLQLPKLSGISATKRIRSLEEKNGIAYIKKPIKSFSLSHSHNNSIDSSNITNTNTNTNTNIHSGNENKNKSVLSKVEILDKDKFPNPVVIVALTANSNTDDRREALGAGCNDYLLKPLNFFWLRNKIVEWGCMQALINFNNWKFDEEGRISRATPIFGKIMT